MKTKLTSVLVDDPGSTIVTLHDTVGNLIQLDQLVQLVQLARW